MSYKILAKYIKDLKFEIPDTETYFEFTKEIAKYKINIDIKNVSQLGSDRIANAIAGKKYNNCLIIDFGTATTFDIIKNGIYVGGVIAPGIKLSMMNLINSTALI